MAPGLNAVSQIGLLPAAAIEAAETPGQAGAGPGFPSTPCSPDLGLTDGDRAFHLPLPGAYTVQLAAKPGQNPTVRIDGVPVQLERTAVKLDSDILSGTVQLEAGAHNLVLGTGPRPDPLTVNVTHRPLGSSAFSALCHSRLRGARSVSRPRYLLTGERLPSRAASTPAERTASSLTGAQVYPPLTHAIQQVPAEKRQATVQVEIPLDPGSQSATLEVEHLRSGRPGPGVSSCSTSMCRDYLTASRWSLVRDAERAPPPHAELTPTRDEMALAAATYQGEPGERLVRLDMRFDPRWTLEINGQLVGRAAACDSGWALQRVGGAPCSGRRAHGHICATGRLLLDSGNEPGVARRHGSWSGGCPCPRLRRWRR